MKFVRETSKYRKMKKQSSSKKATAKKSNPKKMAKAAKPAKSAKASKSKVGDDEDEFGEFGGPEEIKLDELNQHLDDEDDDEFYAGDDF